MSKLNIDQQTINRLFSEKKSDFLIPDYQRPYAWGIEECRTLWDDLFSFAFPDDDSSKFDASNDEYSLGPIVTFKNSNNKLEVIDGQQRLTTLMLLLRAFYDYFKNMQDPDSIETKKSIERCIWKTDEFNKPIVDALKIDSDVATDNDKEEFLDILRNGITSKDQKSQYAENYKFFQDQIQKLLNGYAGYISYFPVRILNNCILLPIEAESQDTALRIFSTLNDRGKPLSDADIFKAQFYKYYSDKGEKNKFIAKWKELEELCDEMFHPQTGSPMDELFTRYMYYERAKTKDAKSTTTEALRKFYEKDSYVRLKNDTAFPNLVTLADFWKDIYNQDKQRFSDRILQKLFILRYAPNGLWTYALSTYFMHYKDEHGNLDEEKLYTFLNRTIAFIWAYAIYRPGVNALRTPLFAEMSNIVNNIEVTYSAYKYNTENIVNLFNTYEFNNNRPITRSMITWYAFQFDGQYTPSNDTQFDIEHIYAKKRYDIEHGLNDKRNLESLGNKVLLEKSINIRAADYDFKDKIKYYEGFTTASGQKKEGTRIAELQQISKNYSDFKEIDIQNRKNQIINSFVEYLKEMSLLDN